MSKDDLASPWKEHSEELFVAFEQEFLLDSSDDLLYEERTFVCSALQLALDPREPRFDYLLGPFDTTVCTKLLTIYGLQGENTVYGVLIEVEFKDSFRHQLHHDWVASFPYCKRSPMEKALDAVFIAAEEQLRAQALIRHALEDRCLNLLIDNFT